MGRIERRSTFHDKAKCAPDKVHLFEQMYLFLAISSQQKHVYLPKISRPLAAK